VAGGWDLMGYCESFGEKSGVLDSGIIFIIWEGTWIT